MEQLEQQGLVQRRSQKLFSTAMAQRSPERCLRRRNHGRVVHGRSVERRRAGEGNGPDRSMADFSWCMSGGDRTN